MSPAVCALAWFFTFADLDAGTSSRAQPAALTRSDGFAMRAECEAVARGVERMRPSLLVYEFAQGRRCFQAPGSRP